MMTLTDFIRLVMQLRETQKAYFKTRDRSVLIQSKKLEKQVDELGPAILRELEEQTVRSPLQ